MNEIKSICVFCGSSSGRKPEFVTAAKEMALEMVHRNIDLVFGGGNDGLMKVVADEFVKHGKKTIGVIPQEYVDNGVEHPNITKMVITKSMVERMDVMKQLSDGFIALPGSLGSFSELFNVLYSIRLGNMSKPCAVLNTASFYNHLLKFLDESVDNGFLNQKQRDILISSDKPNEILNAFNNYEPFIFPRRWV